MRPDKQKVVDEVWDDNRVRSFLAKRPPPDSGDHPDFHRLLVAYRSMRPEDFERFLALFTVDGGDIGATNTRGETLAQHIGAHRHAGPFLKLLEAAAAS